MFYALQNEGNNCEACRISYGRGRCNNGLRQHKPRAAMRAYGKHWPVCTAEVSTSINRPGHFTCRLPYHNRGHSSRICPRKLSALT